MIACLKS
jgi:hypothetical protein